MIGSVLLPSQTKGFWKQGVSSWLGLHVAMNRGRGERDGSEKERERVKAQSCCVCLFIQTVQLLCGFSLAGARTRAHTPAHTRKWLIRTLLCHTFPGTNAFYCTKDQGTEGCWGLFLYSVQVLIIAYTWQKEKKCARDTIITYSRPENNYKPAL